MITLPRPTAGDAAPYYFTYIDKVPQGEGPGGDVFAVLETGVAETRRLLAGLTPEREHHRYEPGKWSIREVVSHINDTERLFVFRAMWFARGLEGALPSFDQNVAIGSAGADARSLGSHLDEFRTVRAATLTLFHNLPPDAWTRRGMASGYSFTVHALAYITAGHVAHHAQILRERYL